ncbi:MAG: hypothetical protein AAFY57_01280 [Cyanobacteria bacterium J06642_2]
MKTGSKKYRFVCTLSFGDIYGQVIAWLTIVFASLAAALASMARSPIYAFATVGLILVVTLPFLLFAFVTTLFNHIEAQAIEAEATSRADTPEIGTVKTAVAS